MLSISGSRSADRTFARQPHFFEPFVVSLVALLGSVALAPWSFAAFARPVALTALLLAWGWTRLRPLAPFAVRRAPVALHRRPLLTMILGAGVALPFVFGGAVFIWKGWLPEGLPIVLLVAAAAGLPLGAALWENRFGRQARLARRRTRRRAAG